MMVFTYPGMDNNNFIVIFLGEKLDCMGGKLHPPPVDETLHGCSTFEMTDLTMSDVDALATMESAADNIENALKTGDTVNNGCKTTIR